MIRHVLWKYQEEKHSQEKKGRLGIYTTEENEPWNEPWIEVKQLFGPAPPVELLYELLRALDLDEFQVESQTETEKRPYILEVRERTSGAQDLLKRVLWNRKFRDAPIVASLHISMFGKLNEGIRGYVNDLHVFISEFPDVFGKTNLEFYNLELKVIEEDDLYQLDDFIYPQ